MNKEFFTYEKVKAAIEKAGFKFFTGHMNLNMIGVRTTNRKADNFDDFFLLLWQTVVNGVTENHIYVNDEFTTDPGIYYLKNKLLNPKGCAVMARGQYPGLWKIGMHFSYEAFVQVKPCNFYRDKDKDDFAEPEGEIFSAIIGLNQHHGYDSANVGNNSAGCQVHKRKNQLGYTLGVAKKSLEHFSNSFTYTLLYEEDFK